MAMDTTNDTLRPDDELLSAWLDNELDETTALRVQGWLQAHPEDAARVRLWAADRDALRSRLDAELDNPLPPVWRDRVFAEPRGGRLTSASRPGTAWWASAAVVALATALAGGAGGWWWARHDAPTSVALQLPRPAGVATVAADAWPRFAAAAHAVYVPERRHPVEVAVEGDEAAQRAQEAHLSGWLTKRLDLPVKLFDLREQGYRLVGGRDRKSVV